jgi:hypothetical protein
MPRKSKELLEKDIKAKERVDKLLDGIELKTNDKKKVSDRIAVLENSKGDKWIESQLDAVTDENEKLKTDLSKSMLDTKQAKEDYKKLFESKNQIAPSLAPSTAPSLAPSKINVDKISKLKVFLIELDNQMRGRNKNRTPNPDVRVSYVLKKLVEIFPETR